MNPDKQLAIHLGPLDDSWTREGHLMWSGNLLRFKSNTTGSVTLFYPTSSYPHEQRWLDEHVVWLKRRE